MRHNSISYYKIDNRKISFSRNVFTGATETRVHSHAKALVLITLLPIVMLTVIFSSSLQLTQNVKAQTDPAAPHWITEEWLNPNYQTGSPVQHTHPFKIILDCLDTDNSCVNNIPSGQGLKSISVFAGPSRGCSSFPDDPCFYGKTSSFTTTGGTLSSKISLDPTAFWQVDLTSDGTTLKSSVSMGIGCTPECHPFISSGTPVPMNLDKRLSRSEVLVTTNVINDNGGTAKPSDFNVFLYHSACYTNQALCSPRVRDQVQDGADGQGKLYLLDYTVDGDRIFRTLNYFVNFESKRDPVDCHAYFSPTSKSDSICEDFDNTGTPYDISFAGDCFRSNVDLSRNTANGNPYRCTITLNDKLPDKTTDSDGDGIPNFYERHGIDINNDGRIDLDLRQLGANPMHKDLFVEVDYMQFHRPVDAAINDVINSFANAPLLNPDGGAGIKLHVLVDEEIPHQDAIDLSGLASVKSTNFGTVAERSNPNGANILAAKQLVYHYSFFAHDQSPPNAGRSGIAEGIPSMNFLVTLGHDGFGRDDTTGHIVGSPPQQAATFMHELGHNLGLHHGGADDSNCKPNYLSVMSYSRQFPSIIANRPLDYSRSTLNALNKANLDESKGISDSTPTRLVTVYGPPPIQFSSVGQPFDWNRNGDPSDSGVSADLNHIADINDLYVVCPASANEILNGHDDWKNLIYTLGQFSSTAKTAIVENEISIDDIIKHRLLLIDSINNAIQGIPTSSIKLPASAFQLPASEVFKNAIQSESNPNNIGSIASVLQSKNIDDLDKAITMLSSLREKMDSSAGGDPGNDLITNEQDQRKIVPMIDNLIDVLELQK